MGADDGAADRVLRGGLGRRREAQQQPLLRRQPFSHVALAAAGGGGPTPASAPVVVVVVAAAVSVAIRRRRERGEVPCVPDGPAVAVAQRELLDAKLPRGEGAGLIEEDGIHTRRLLEHVATLDQDAEPRADRAAHHDGGGCGEAESARARHDQHGAAKHECEELRVTDPRLVQHAPR